MISPEEIKKKAARKYGAFLRATLAEESFFPLDIPVGGVPKSYPELQQSVTALIRYAKEKAGFGYTLWLEPTNTRKHGYQSLPKRICIESASDYLQLVGKVEEFEHFVLDIALIRATLPILEPWLCQYPMKVVANHGDWPELLRVCEYFQNNPKPNLYIRELPIQVHTKFVEEHKEILRSLLEAILSPEQLGSIQGKKPTFEQRFSLRYREPLIPVRILDVALQQQYGFPIADFSIGVSDFSQLKIGTPQCFITENAMPFLTFPPMKNSIAVLGGGGAVNLLKVARWLKDCSIFYWGDLDVDGFRILSQVRSHFPSTQSILMDRETYSAFEAFTVADPKAKADVPTHLTPAEKALYTQLATTQQRLEQERISQAYINRYLGNYLNRY